MKNRLLLEIPHLKAYSQGRETLQSFEKEIGPPLMTACQFDDDVMHLFRVGQVELKEVIDSKLDFNGSFHENCQQDAVPQSLLAIVNMILNVSNNKHQKTRQPAVTISQLMVFNSKKRTLNKG